MKTGLLEVDYAKITGEAPDGSLTYGEIKKLGESISFSSEPTSEIVKVYGSSRVIRSSSTTSSEECTLVVDRLSLEARKDLFDLDQEDNGKTVYFGNKPAPYVGFGFISIRERSIQELAAEPDKPAEFYVVNVRCKCQFRPVERADHTLEETIEFRPTELNCIAIPKNDEKRTIGFSGQFDSLEEARQCVNLLLTTGVTFQYYSPLDA